MSFTTSNIEPVDRIGVKGPLIFNETSFSLAWTDKPNDTYYIQGYLPKDEKPERFNEMLTLHLFYKDIKVKALSNKKFRNLKVAKRQIQLASIR